MIGQSRRPAARQEGLIVERLADETLVYDLERHRAFCLNRPAARFWRRCDGATTVARLSDFVSEEIGVPNAEAITWWTLRRLERAHLLHGTPLPRGVRACSRRDLLKQAGTAGAVGLLLPSILTIVAPTAAQAASATTWSACWNAPTANQGKCCSDVNPNRLCITIGGFGVCFGAQC